MKLRQISAVLAVVTLCFAAGCAAENTDDQQEEVVKPDVNDSNITPKSCAPPGTCQQLSRNCKIPNSPACQLYFSKCVPPCS